MTPKKQVNSKQTMPQVDKGLMKKMNVLEAKLSRIIENRCLDENDDVDAWFEETFGSQDCSNLSPNSVTVNICLQIGFVHKCFTKDSSKAKKYANASLKIVQDALRIGKRDILTADVVWKFQTIYVRTKVLDGLEAEVIANWKPILDEIKNDHPSESLEDLSMLRQTLEVLKKDVTNGDGWVIMGGLRGQLTVDSFYEKLTSIPQLRAHCKKELKRINDEINSNTNGNLERAELLFQEVSDYFETKDKDQNRRGTEPYMHSEEMRRQYLNKINEVLKIKMEHYLARRRQR